MGSGNTGTGEDMEKKGLIITDLLIELSNFDFPSSFFSFTSLSQIPFVAFFCCVFFFSSYVALLTSSCHCTFLL